MRAKVRRTEQECGQRSDERSRNAGKAHAAEQHRNAKHVYDKKDRMRKHVYDKTEQTLFYYLDNYVRRWYCYCR